MKLYKGYFGNEDFVFTLVRPADNKAHFYSLYGGHGEILKIEDVTEEEKYEPNRSSKESKSQVQRKGNQNSH